MVYIPAGKSWKGGSFFVRANVSAHLLSGIIRAEVAASDKILQVERIQPFETVIDDMISQEHLTALLSSVFAALRCLLAAIGLYGVFAYSVSRRTSEFGIRIALGAQRHYAYHLTSKGNKTALLFVLFHKCVGRLSLQQLVQLTAGHRTQTRHQDRSGPSQSRPIHRTRSATACRLNCERKILSR